MENGKDELKGIFDKAKSFFKNMDELITEEIKGSEMVDYLKDKAKDVQTVVEEKVKYFTTEEVDATDKNTSLEIKLILAGISKDKISISVEDEKLIILIDDKDVPKEVKKHWNISKSKLFYDFSEYVETARVEDTTSTFENGILTISIPKKERSKEKKKITIL
jgi:HSP20 family molecular chaperone IbpA